MKADKWIRMTLIIWIIMLCLMGTVILVMDPYYHFHMPKLPLMYQGYNALYNNNGVLRNDDYDALILGTSMTSGFSEEEASELFGENFKRITFIGEGSYIQNENLKTGIIHQPELKHVIRSIDPLWFVADSEWKSTEDYPDYLYDENPFNDVKYLYNLDVWNEAVIPTVTKTVQWYGMIKDMGGMDSINSGINDNKTDEDIRADEYLNGVNALEYFERAEKRNEPIDPAETEAWLETMTENLETNCLSTIQENPDIRFDLFVAPYSILWWDNSNQAGPGRVDRRVDMEKRALEIFINTPNVHVYAFNDEFDMITDLTNYVDDIHYRPEINSRILHWIHDGEHEITADNYPDYIDRIRAFYTTYDYDSIYD